MKTKTTLALALVGFALSGTARASSSATSTQTFNFPFVYSGVTTSSSTQIVDFPNSGNDSATVLPFDTNLGTLDSVNFLWTFGGSFSGVTAADGGWAAINMGTNTYIGGIMYYGSGTWAFGEAASNSPLSIKAEQASVGGRFDAAAQGYNPAIWTVVDGNSSYIAKLDLSGGSLRYSGLASGTFNMNADLVVTYNYTAAAIPEPSAFALLGLGALGLVARRRRVG